MSPCSGTVEVAALIEGEKVAKIQLSFSKSHYCTCGHGAFLGRRIRQHTGEQKAGNYLQQQLFKEGTQFQSGAPLVTIQAMLCRNCNLVFDV